MQLDLKIGDICYLNTLPLRMGLAYFGVEEVFLSTPTEVNKALLKGEIDIGPVSSVFYLENQEKLLALENICIGSEGEVKSVVLVSRYPLENLDKKVVSLTRASATSRRLLQIIFREKDLSPIFIDGEFEMFEEEKVDASLLIGDTALHAYLNYTQKRGFYLYDLGKEWRNLIGKPMVYALWVVRREVANFKPYEVEKVSRVLFQALNEGLSHLDLVVKKASEISGISEKHLRNYYETLNYYFSEDFLSGLIEFGNRALPGSEGRIKFFRSSEISLSRICKV
jgi:chorismate dehydratase